MNNKPILLWKHQKLANAWTLRIGDSRYIGLIRTDRKGESYWKFKEFANKPNSNDDSNNSNQKSEASLDKLIQENDQSTNQPEATKHTSS